MPSSLNYLLNRYVNKTCTPEEKEELMQLLQQSGNDEAVQQFIEQMIIDRPVTHTMPDSTAQAVLQAIFEADEAQVVPIVAARVRRIPAARIAAAAIILLLVASGSWLWLTRAPKNQVAVVDQQIIKYDVKPGGTKALLTLANGSVIVLDSAANGVVAQQGNANVVKLKNGQLAYKTADGKLLNTADEPMAYNTLSTPNGGEYKIELPDGSKVWLNAASSITYPTVFDAKERKVQVTGEAYFEVAKLVTVDDGKRVPFVVDIKNKTTGNDMGQVQVLGTHFNINAYTDEEAVKTTLLEGSVKFVNRSVNSSVMLTPGEQAIAKQHSPLTINHSPDADGVMAWKNGQFHFENADMKTVMRQLSRWYDVAVVYKRNADKEDPLFFEVSRNTNLSDVLKALSIASGAHFSIEDKKIVVL